MIYIAKTTKLLKIQPISSIQYFNNMLNLDNWMLLVIFIWFDSYSLHILLEYGVLRYSVIRIY